MCAGPFFLRDWLCKRGKKNHNIHDMYKYQYVSIYMYDITGFCILLIGIVPSLQIFSCICLQWNMMWHLLWTRWKLRQLKWSLMLTAMHHRFVYFCNVYYFVCSLEVALTWHLSVISGMSHPVLLHCLISEISYCWRYQCKIQSVCSDWWEETLDLI